ncbi:dipeptide ABC transporter ATP-binding protein [Paramicrobacterium agarici]|uniref:Peptide/nickel transport system ATP-binding protein n=1 Tax=Paramicrobacterium agarici TaxID=630514 RepID=A0A2A9E0H5_9MICO|nr:ABC transporter ATP-binding protein [Microbacterium agarici]PFG31680.1 peptide/nickel transport system ATP-binding protein [Microbacterium agarici]TQO21584.1 peptide/nickel transport system ATP-binding protein [Microbacterium agarici]
MNASEPLLSIRDLTIGFSTQNGFAEALHGVSFDVMPGETVAIVGESGSGKSTTAHGIINLLPENGKITGGEVMFEGRDLAKLSSREIESVRGREIGFVPQDPMSNLNPVWSVGFQVKEAIRANGVATSKRDVEKHAVDVLKQAGLDDAERRLKQFPHQFSGGMRQRVLIGIGLSASPKLLIADEPTSALDVTVQRVILDNLAELTMLNNTAVLFITHDLGLAAERAEKLIVMYKGNIVEAGDSREILQNPQHPYTQRLVAAAPSLASQRIQAAVEHKPVEDLGGEFDLAQAAEERAEEIEDIADTTTPVIEVSNLTKVFKIRRGNFRSENFTAVNDVSFSVAKGTTTALVGESGSGKSTIAKMALGLETITSGSIAIDGDNLAAMSRSGLMTLRRRMQPVFQDPYGSLDPMRNIADIIGEPLRIHKVGSAADRGKRVRELLDQVALPQQLINRYPNELSGGQRQRIAIARALALKPDIVVLDEAVSALDVLVQAQILQLLAELQSELGLTYLFITHDLAVVRVIADNVVVMQKGEIVETGSTDEVFGNPRESYTRNLLDAIPGANIPLGA